MACAFLQVDESLMKDGNLGPGVRFMLRWTRGGKVCGHSHGS